MSETTLEDRKAKLRRSVEVLAMNVVMGAGEEDWDSDSPGLSGGGVAEALRTIAEQAKAAGCGEIAEIVSSLLTPDGATGAQLSAGIQRFEEVLARQDSGRRETPGAPAEAPTSLIQDPELVAEFITEAREHLANIENQVLTLERDPANVESLHSAFRGFHTIKGLAGFLALAEIQAVAHEVETVLDLARNENLAITPTVIDAVLEGADYLRTAVTGVEEMQKTGQLPPAADPAQLVRRVRVLVEGGETDNSEPPKREKPQPEATPTPDTAGNRAAPAKEARKQTQSVRVETGKLDHLVDMVGELVVAHSLLEHDPDMALVASQRLQRHVTQLARITTDVQRTAMSMRMVPVGTLFKRMSRLVRDLSRKEGKQVELTTSGEETELDRNIVEEVADPLMHMIRNAVGHGIETPAEREAVGKPPVGQVKLAAYHQSGFIMIELTDNGRGISREKVLAKARQRGLVSDAAELSDAEVQNLIFEPGFSTAAEVTDVSGRGVGMDVVKRNITRVRGRVDIRSVEGQGTTFTLKMPLTLAIIDGLIVGVGEQKYIVPIYTVREMLRPTEDLLSTLHGREEMVRVRGHLLPMVRLYRRFGIEPRSEDPTQCLLLVAETLGKNFCLMVDDLIGKQEVVIKSLGESLMDVEGVAGGAILGDGHVGLILDMDGMYGRSSDG